MSTSDYMTQFTTMKRFALKIALDPFLEASILLGGLRKDIRERVSMMKLGIIIEVYGIVMIVERELTSTGPSQSQGSIKRQGGGQYLAQKSSKRQGSGSTSGSGSSSGNWSRSNICNGYPWEPCMLTFMICHNCGVKGHVARNCPHPR